MADPLDQTLVIHLTVAEAREVLTPLVKDLRGIALSGKKYHYTQVAGTEEIVDDMLQALWAKSLCCTDPDRVWDDNDQKWTCLSCGQEQHVQNFEAGEESSSEV